MQVMIVVRNNISNTIIIENSTDFIRYFYCIYLDIKEIDK